MHKICTPEFGVVDNLVIVLNEELERTDNANRILRAFGYFFPHDCKINSILENALIICQN